MTDEHKYRLEWHVNYINNERLKIIRLILFIEWVEHYSELCLAALFNAFKLIITSRAPTGSMSTSAYSGFYTNLREYTMHTWTNPKQIMVDTFETFKLKWTSVLSRSGRCRHTIVYLHPIANNKVAVIPLIISDCRQDSYHQARQPWIWCSKTTTLTSAGNSRCSALEQKGWDLWFRQNHHTGSGCLMSKTDQHAVN